MEEKKGFSKKLNAFFAGKGFYIVLLLCAGLVGTSFWLMGRGSRADVERDPVKESEITASAVEATEAPRGSIPVMNTEDDTLPLGTGVLPAAAGMELPEAEAPAVQEQPSPAEETQTQSEPDYFIWPVNGTLARSFSVETLSYDRTMSDWRIHRGWDIAGSVGAEVLAAGGGTVTAVYEDEMLGTVIEIDHGGELVSVYANLDGAPLVGVGQTVQTGSLLGAIGTSALSESGEEPHLHFAMRRSGSYIDPAEYLPEP